jgi:hypothetical protein
MYVDTPMLIAIAVATVAVVLIIAAIAWLTARRKRSKRLQDSFGTEYERTVAKEGDRQRAEADLEERQERVEKLRIRPLPAADREYYQNAWAALQSAFVDDPRGSVVRANELIDEVMVKRGYPVADFDQQADDISVDHPDLVVNYRKAHAVTLDRETASTEDLRDAIIRYRSLFSELVESERHAESVAS